MHLKKDVIVDTTGKTALTINTTSKEISEKDEYIVRALLDGMTGRNEFTELVVKNENISEIEADFRMAMFVEDYGDFLESDADKVIPVD